MAWFFGVGAGGKQIGGDGASIRVVRASARNWRWERRFADPWLAGVGAGGTGPRGGVGAAPGAALTPRISEQKPGVPKPGSEWFRLRVWAVRERGWRSYPRLGADQSWSELSHKGC